jgi:hypothetical protein
VVRRHLLISDSTFTDILFLNNVRYIKKLRRALVEKFLLQIL